MEPTPERLAELDRARTALGRLREQLAPRSFVSLGLEMAPPPVGDTAAASEAAATATVEGPLVLVVRLAPGAARPDLPARVDGFDVLLVEDAAPFRALPRAGGDPDEGGGA